MNTKVILINIVIVVCVFACLEILTRFAIFLYKGDSTAGMVGRSANLLYQPFLMFGENHDFNLKNYEQNKKGLNVLILGGSTAESFPDKLIKDKLSKHFNKEVNLYNSAFSGHNARQELIFLALWGNTIKPDLIISLDGANDIVHSLRINRVGTFFTNDTYDIVLTKPYLGPIIYIMQKSQFYNSILRVMARAKTFESADYSAHIKIYIDAQRNLSLLSQTLKSKHISILQPYLGFKKPKHEEEKKFTHYDFRNEVVKNLYNYTHEELLKLHNETDSYYLDGRFFYSNNKNRIFTDDVHFFKNEGYEIILNQVINLLISENIKF